MAEEFSILGKRLPRADALEKVNGEVKFVSDIQLPNMLHIKLLRSPHAHAKIIKIDTGQAEALPGVKGVLTHKNVPKVHPRNKLEYLLDQTVHCPGEEVAMVAAETEEIAEEALNLIEVDYEVLPAIFDMEEAMKPGATLAHIDYGTNMYHGVDYNLVPRCSTEGWLPLGYGDVDQGFRDADLIVDGTYETPMHYNCSPLPRSVVAQWTGDELSCWCDTQGATRTRDDIAKCLNMPQSRVRVIATSLVGGYGAKEPQKIATLAALMAKKTGRPVKVVYSRAEDAIATHHRMNTKTYMKLGLKRDGTITAIYSKMITGYGRDCVFPFWVPATGMVGTLNALYKSQSSKSEACQVITNIVEHGAFNGFGDPEAGFCFERLADEAAEKLDMDPVEFRLKNCCRYGDRAMDYRTVLTGPIKWGVFGRDLDSFPECIKRAAEKSEWERKWKGWKTPVEINGSKRKGIGIAIGIHHTQYRDCSAIVKMHQDGSAMVLVCAQEIGQGIKSAICQVVGEVLGIHYGDVNATLADTGVVPAGYANTGSAGTSSHITACKLAADDAKRKLFEVAANRLGAKPDELEAKDRRIFVRTHPERGISIAEVCTWAFQIIGTANTPPTETIIDEKSGQVIFHFAIAATIVEVEVDTDTGELNVLRLTSAHDCGRAINPQLIENQINLSLTSSNGWVRSEDFVIDKNTGIVLNPNLLDYKIMTFLDMPKMEDIREIIVEAPCAWGPFGAKGMSETAHSTSAPAIANAIYNAIGVRVRGDHLTPERILEALGK